MKDNASAFTAKEYDRKIRLTLPFYDDFYQQVIDVANAHFEKKLNWLDIGCGTGKMAEVALPKLKIEKFAFCDNSTQMIKIAQERFSGKNTEFFTASIQELGIQQRFDIITAIQVFHYFSQEERLATAEKCYQALEPDGLFISFENFAPYTGAGKKLFLKRWRTYQLSQGKSPSECDKHIQRYGKDYFPISISEHLNVLRKSGFQAAEVLWVSNMQVGMLGIKQPYKPK